MAETSTTTNMALILPTPGERLGPTWASDLNSALTLIDSHDHSAGKGAQIGVDGITINGNFDLNKSGSNYPILNSTYYNLTRITSQPIVNNTLYSYGASTGTDGELYFRDNAGNQVKITSGGSLNIPVSTSAANVFAVKSTFITANYDIGTATGTDAQAVTHLCNAGTAITITLPTGGSSGVGLGRFYIVKDITGNAAVNNITVQVNGTSSDTIDDASTSVVINSNFQAVYFLYGATNKWVRI